MKSIARSGYVFAAVAAVCLCSAVNNRAATTREGAEAEAMMQNMDADQRAAFEARAKDKAWKPAAREVGLIQVGDGKAPGELRNFCLNKEGNILACFAPANGASAIRIYSPAGKLLKSLAVEVKPMAVCVAKDGNIFVAGDGRVLKLNAAGKVIASAPSPIASEPVIITKETEDMVKEMIAQSGRTFAAELAAMKTTLEKRRADVTGLAVTDGDLFMAVPAPSDFSYRIYRFDHSLGKPKLVVEKLRGCCGQMDVQTHDNQLWVPHNARHAVENLDREGKQLAKFGKSGRVKASDFGGCCEPKNIRVLDNGDILAAESGPPTCIKRFSASGEFKEVVALVENTKGDCVRVTVEMSPDGGSYYMLDTTRDAIRVFAAKR
ncbi:MAG: hypothetical protein JWM99_2065 [Verrucomicrobiales bacterium]|nr:hypothetical protein [Verrucomicrobiales bacterium]